MDNCKNIKQIIFKNFWFLYKRWKITLLFIKEMEKDLEQTKNEYRYKGVKKQAITKDWKNKLEVNLENYLKKKKM